MEKYWSKINSFEDVMACAKQGAVWGLAFSAMIGLGIILTVFDVLPYEGSKQVAIVGITIELCLVLFLSWRVSSGKGYVSAVLLLLIFLIEIGAKIVGGSTGIGWIVFYAFILLGLITGVRATFSYKKYATSQEAVEAF